MIFTRTTQSTEDSSGRFGAPTVTTIEGAGILVTGDPQEYEAMQLSMTIGPTVLFTPATYPLRAFTDEFVLPGDTTEINSVVFTVKAILKVVAPDGYVIVSRIAIGA